MIFLVLNIAVTLFLVFFTYLLDHKIKSDNPGMNSFSVSILLTTIESFIFLFILLMKNFWFDALTSQAMKIIFSIDAIFFTMLSFGLMNLGNKPIHPFSRIIKYALYFLGIYIVYFRFNSVDVTFDKGIIIASEYLFTGQARNVFPWTWFTLFTALYRYAIPIICFLFLMVFQEDKSTQLERYQSFVIAEAFCLMWIVNATIKYISYANPAFSMLFLYSYLFLYVVIYTALTKTSVPSGKALLVNLFKTAATYIIPASVVGVLCLFIQPVGNVFTPGFVVLFTIASIVIIIVSLWISTLLTNSSRLYSADYETSLEKDLASVDYKDAEMDQITAKMTDIIKKNIESSSMTVYILSGQNELSVAYSSNNMQNKISLTNPMFDTLLNINKSIVLSSQIEKEHDLSVVQNELSEFFKVTKSDALFILNEGHNIFGIITLGRKISGDEYKDYDYNVFVKLYSYFFVFGYYMRNISNKDVISVVNREIKMSSQIITSIQENIDQVKNQKIDIGYMMVPAHNIGGEFIDMIRLTDTRHLFVVGDLSGKGIAASMNMVILKSIIRTYLAEVHDFKELVVKINSFIRDSLQKGTIFAGLFALVDFEKDTMYYINCGIPALMAYTQVYNNVIEIQGSGHILGFVKDISPYISVKSTKLNRGDTILACTDGLIQSHSLRGEQFGKERVQQAILDNVTYPAQRMAQFTFDGLLKFMSKEMEDDVSILVLKYEGLPEEEKTDEKSEETADTQTQEVVAETVDSPMEAVESESEIPEEVETTGPVETEVASEEAPVEEEKKSEPLSMDDDMGLPEGFEMPDLSDLDAMMKEAGL